MHLTRQIRSILERLLAKQGYEIRRIGESPKGYIQFLADIKKYGIHPSTVFDIGVGNGTPWLYESFPGAKFVLIEPQDVFSDSISRICKRLDADFIQAALGADFGSAHLFIPEIASTSASLKKWTAQTTSWIEGRDQSSAGILRKVDIITLDSINKYDPPFVIKIDTEGSEFDIMHGSRNTMAHTDLIILEISITPRFEDEANLEEIVGYLRRSGFDLIDFIELHQSELGGRLRYVDAAFIRRGVGG